MNYGANGSGLAVPVDPSAAGSYLLSLDATLASDLFVELADGRQLEIIEATPDPYDREELYYLVPDCTELVQASSVERVLEVLNTAMGTGLTCGILSAVSVPQFTEMFTRTVFQDGAPDREMVALWVAELTELEPDELTGLLNQLDVELLAELFRDRIDMPHRYKGMAIDSGMVELEQIEFGEDEQARMLAQLMWASDPEVFIAVLRELLTQDEEAGTHVEEGMDPEEEEPTPPPKDDRLATFDMSKIDQLLPPAKPSTKTEDDPSGADS
ncbi:hypothetical protein HOK31_26385 [Candidatus Poribacteria bacterium]|nr:hypothetical protein [Candidatus Poribacteria bacterium]